MREEGPGWAFGQIMKKKREAKKFIANGEPSRAIPEFMDCAALYLMIALAGWRIWEAHRTSAAMVIWAVALALNFLWSPVFFGMQNPGAAFAVILPLLALIYGFIAQAWRLDRVSAWLFVPYAAWVSFATVLNGAIWQLN